MSQITIIANQYIIWETQSTPTIESKVPDARFPVVFTSTELADEWMELKAPMGWIDFRRYTPHRLVAAEQIRGLRFRGTAQDTLQHDLLYFANMTKPLAPETRISK